LEADTVPEPAPEREKGSSMGFTNHSVYEPVIASEPVNESEDDLEADTVPEPAPEREKGSSMGFTNHSVYEPVIASERLVIESKVDLEANTVPEPAPEREKGRSMGSMNHSAMTWTIVAGIPLYSTVAERLTASERVFQQRHDQCQGKRGAISTVSRLTGLSTQQVKVSIRKYSNLPTHTSVCVCVIKFI
jgi:hypothetical protein